MMDFSKWPRRKVEEALSFVLHSEEEEIKKYKKMLKSKQLQVGLKWIASHKKRPTCIMCESVKKICYVYSSMLFYLHYILNKAPE